MRFDNTFSALFIIITSLLTWSTVVAWLIYLAVLDIWRRQKSVANKMPLESDICVLGSLFGDWRIHSNIEFGE